MSDSITKLQNKLKEEKIQHEKLFEAYRKLVTAHSMLAKKYTDLCVERYEEMTSKFKTQNPYML